MSSRRARENHRRRRRLQPFEWAFAAVLLLCALFVAWNLWAILAGGVPHLGRALASAEIRFALRLSLITTTVSSALCMALAIPSAYCITSAPLPGRRVLRTLVELPMSLPYLLVVILVMLVLGNSVPSLLVALCVTSWCNTARAVRGVILQLKSSEYVMAAQTLGASPWRIIVRHLLPNTMGILILNTATSIPNYIFQESTLSFLGIGLQPPDTSLGVIISLGQDAMQFYPLQLIFPAAILVLIVLSFNLLGDGLRDALDPKLRK